MVVIYVQIRNRTELFVCFCLKNKIFSFFFLHKQRECILGQVKLIDIQVSFNSNLENSILLEYKDKKLRKMFHLLVGLCPYFSILLGKYGKQYIKKDKNSCCGNPIYLSCKRIPSQKRMVQLIILLGKASSYQVGSVLLSSRQVRSTFPSVFVCIILNQHMVCLTIRAIVLNFFQMIFLFNLLHIT